MWLPPITTRESYHQSTIRTSFPTHPVPETDYLHRCFSLLGLFKLCRSCALCEVLFLLCSHFWAFAYLLITWTVYPFMIVCCLPRGVIIVCLPPASTLSTNSVYESALLSVYLTPVTDSCLSDLSCDSIKLHMDPWRHCLLITMLLVHCNVSTSNL